MTKRNRWYWICQFGGWGAFVAGNLISAFLRDQLVWEVGFNSGALFVFGIVVTHFFRSMVKEWKWTQLPIPSQIPRIVISAIAMSVIFSLILASLNDLILQPQQAMLTFKGGNFLLWIMNFSFLFFLWNAIYFAFHYVESLRSTEIRNLELKAAKTEIELSSFKNQMNPHFMFNAMNSIRALIDEEPAKAKQAVTLLSGILRSTLMLGKQRTVPLKEELNLVRSYLQMEQIRYEERLRVAEEIEDGLLEWPVPPLVIQTIVENAIKHGISKIPEGGEVHLTFKEQSDKLEVIVRNSGTLTKFKSESGIGLRNTKKRLRLMYQGDASFKIHQQDDTVVATLQIPKTIAV